MCPSSQRNTWNLKPVMKIFDNGLTTAAKCRGERKLVEKVAEMRIADMDRVPPTSLSTAMTPPAWRSCTV